MTPDYKPDGYQTKEFIFGMEGIFLQDSSNDYIFGEAVKPMIDYVLTGYNATVFAYGMTSAGKTYTMLGDGQKKAGLVLLAI